MRSRDSSHRNGGGAPTVCVLARSRDLARAAEEALLADGVRPCSARALQGVDDAVIVVGRPGVSLTEQRRDAAQALHEHAPHRIVLVTDLDQPGPLRRLLNAGVHGLVPSLELNGALGATVRAVATGQLCVSERLRAALVARPLSARERQVLALVIMGQSNGEIARRLHLAESTVKTHLASMFDKLGVRSRAEAADLVSDPQEMLSTGVLGLRADSAAQHEPAR